MLSQLTIESSDERTKVSAGSSREGNAFSIEVPSN